MKKAFTLAEVLITLGIIGIVAAMTIPTLMQKYQEQATAAQLKKEYSILQSAFTMAVQENDTPDVWINGQTGATGCANILNVLAPYLKITKNCGSGTGCFPSSYKNLYGDTNSQISVEGNTNDAKFQLIDGSIMRIYVNWPTCNQSVGPAASQQNACGSILVDINGQKTPNQYGVDVFLFWITKSGILPLGTSTDTVKLFSDRCNKDNNTNLSGEACAAWVIYNENMDYRHCSGLDWNGPTKCP